MVDQDTEIGWFMDGMGARTSFLPMTLNFHIEFPNGEAHV